MAPTGDPVIARDVPKALGIKNPPTAPMAEIKPSAAAVSVTASCCACSSLPPCFYAVEGDLAKDNRDHLEGRAAAQACGQKQAHKDQIEGDKTA